VTKEQVGHFNVAKIEHDAKRFEIVSRIGTSFQQQSDHLNLP